MLGDTGSYVAAGTKKKGGSRVGSRRVKNLNKKGDMRKDGYKDVHISLTKNHGHCVKGSGFK